MKIKNSMMILLVLILLASFSLGVVSAETIDDSSVYSVNNSDLDVISVESLDSSVSDNNFQLYVSSLNNNQNISVSDITGDNNINNINNIDVDTDVNIENNDVVTNETFFYFFDVNGTLKDDVSTNLIFKGEFANLTGSILHIVINRPVSIVCDDVVLRDIGIHLVEGSSGSNLTGFSIISNKTSNGIWLSDSNYNHITNCSINLAGSGKFAMPIIRSSYNVIDNCDIYENGSSVLVLSYANFNNITNCNIKSASSNVVYINCYDILDFKAGVNGTDYGYNNSFVNNNVSGVGTMFCIGFQIMGSDNEFINNTVIGASSAFSSPAPSNWANYTNNNNYFEGNHVENCTAGFVFGSQNNTAINNTVVNSGSGISASNPSIIVGNDITCNGTNVGIKLTGSNIVVENNAVVTDKGAGISSTKSDNVIVGNNVSSGAQYAITLGSGFGNVVTDNYLKTNFTIGDCSVSGTGVNTIENNTPESNVVTNETFFYFFDENGVLKDTAPVDLIFQGEFANLNGNVSRVVINRPVSIKGDKAVLNNMGMDFINGADGSVVDNLTFINYINSCVLINLENVSNVAVSNNNFTSYGNSSRCVFLNNATECEVLNNAMFMNSTVYNSRAVLVGGDSAFNKISNNDIKVADFNGIDINPYVGGGHDNLVFNNTITSIADIVSSWNYAIQLGGPNNTAMNNTIYHVFMGIFSATNGNGSVIVGNNISDLTGGFSSGTGGNAGGCAISAGIKNIVENNTITDYDLINTGINTGINCTVSGNTIIANTTNSGINVNTGSVVLGNVIQSNYTNSQLINSNYQNVVIANNTVTSSNGSAIKVKSTSVGTSVVEGNVIVITEGTSPAIETTCSNIHIIDNIITVASGVGISSTKSDNVIVGNNVSSGAQYAITLGSGSGNVVTDNYLKTNFTIGDRSVSGTGVNTIENNTPESNVVTNETFFYFFDENGTLKDDVPTNLIFKGEFEGLPGISALVINKSVVMDGVSALLKNISIMTSGELTDGLVINNFIINNINSAGIIIRDSNVTISNSVIKVINDDDSNNPTIQWIGDNGTMSNCSFTDCSASYGGAVYWIGDNGTMSNCSFTDCSASYGGAVYWSGADGAVVNSKFTGNKAVNGSAIYMLETLDIDGCSFADNQAKTYNLTLVKVGEYINSTLIGGDNLINAIYDATSNDVVIVNGVSYTKSDKELNQTIEVTFNLYDGTSITKTYKSGELISIPKGTINASAIHPESTLYTNVSSNVLKLGAVPSNNTNNTNNTNPKDNGSNGVVSHKDNSNEFSEVSTLPRAGNPLLVLLLALLILPVLRRKQ